MAIRQELIEQIDGRKTGFLACTCGWVCEVNPLHFRFIAEEVLRLTWAEHSGRLGDLLD